jgi:hypothetical protein
MLNRSPDELSKEHIDALVREQVPEGPRLDYKRELPAGTRDGRKEFLKDISSFANAGGGYLLFGVDEAQGVPVAANGLSGIDPDSEILRLEEIARSGIDPRIPGFRVVAIPGFPQGPVIAAHVPRSWAAPHRVAADADSRFWSRGSSGKFAMDTSQIRSAFLQGAEIPDRIRRFRDDRLAKIADGEAPMRLSLGLRLILHLVPTESIVGSVSVDLAKVASNPPFCLGNGGSYADARYNFEGYVSLGGNARGYVQVFRNGIIEAVGVGWGWAEKDKKHVNLGEVEVALAEGATRLVRKQYELGVEPPVSLLMSIFGVRGYELKRSYNYSPRDDHPRMDEASLLLPPVELSGIDVDPKVVMRPSFDALWQAFGEPRSHHYDERGVWNPKFRWE